MLEKYPYEYPTLFSAETEIVWRFNPSIFPFVREAWALGRNSNKEFFLPKREDDLIVVGYALRPSDGEGTQRRYFFIRPDDFAVDAGPPPCIGVDPLTVEIGVAGIKTARCYEPPTPDQKSLIAQAIEIYGYTRTHRREMERRRNEHRKRQGPRPPRNPKSRW